MCMKGKDGNKESCEVAKNLAALGVRVTNIEERMDKFDGSLNDGFKNLSTAINDLGHDFGERMNIIEKKVVDEKAKWGDSFRKWLDWTLRVILGGCAAAMGMTAYKMLFS